MLSSALMILLWVAMIDPTTAEQIQTLDWHWHQAMVEMEWFPLTVFAAFLSAMGGLWVATPIWILVLLWLGQRKKWRGFWVCFLAVISSQIISWTSKFGYGRLRPEDHLLETTAPSFPSGHATNAAVMGFVLAFTLVPAGRERTRYLTIGIGYALTMALSRTYLRVHWSSDVVAGLLLGVSSSLWAVVFIQKFAQERLQGREKQPRAF